MPSRRRPPATRRRAGLVMLVPLLVVAAVGTVLVLRSGGPARQPSCTASAGGSSYGLDLAQAANAATIAQVARQVGLGDHAVTIGLATALQESKLHNLPYGDRDSVGLFQQRPSQGWGTPAELLDPRFAARAFFTHLARVPGWQAMAVADAAQAVQRSAAGSAYADWEPAARTLARALTGEVPRGLACYYVRAASSARGLVAAMVAETVGVPAQPQAGWSAASWLVAQAAQYSVESVSFAGQTWTRASGRWRPRGPATQVVTYTVRPRAFGG